MAKSEGRGTFRFFEPEMDARVQNKHALERDLRNALARSEFELYYEPSVDLRTGQVCSVEALMRWNHPQRGLVSPRDFIPVAEECGLIVPLGQWALEQACCDAAAWPRHLRVAVNLSPSQFRVGNLLQMVSDTLARTGLPASRLELEITETLLLQNNNTNLAVLHKLRGLGISIAMDDFGTGYSSLSHLRSFPFDKVKIDRSFIDDITRRDDAVFIVRAIVGLCGDLGIRMTTEGVENIDQLSILLRNGCREAQGFLFALPQPADRVAALIASRSLMPTGLSAAADAPWAEALQG
jgi:EAL domain-containing protein (putative c-di-GMP-specific phosphodiesterase class I)